MAGRVRTEADVLVHKLNNHIIYGKYRPNKDISEPGIVEIPVGIKREEDVQVDLDVDLEEELREQLNLFGVPEDQLAAIEGLRDGQKIAFNPTLVKAESFTNVRSQGLSETDSVLKTNKTSNDSICGLDCSKPEDPFVAYQSSPQYAKTYAIKPLQVKLPETGVAYLIGYPGETDEDIEVGRSLDLVIQVNSESLMCTSETENHIPKGIWLNGQQMIYND